MIGNGHGGYKAEHFSHDEMLVTRQHVGLVRNELRHLGIGSKEKDRDARLDLTLLGLDDVDSSRAVGELHARHGSPSRLDTVIRELRDRFAARHAGWVPTMGKNRVVHGVHGLEGHVSGGGAGEPRVHLPAAQDRHAGPAASGGRGAGRRGAGVRVGILDTHLYPHTRLEGRFIAPAEALLRTSPERPTHAWAGHATFVAGIVLGRAPGARLEVQQVLDDADASATVWHVARRMVRYLESGVDVLNLSLGCYTSDGEPPLALTRAVDALSPDVVLVAASGNHGNLRPSGGEDTLTPRTPLWPAAFDTVIGVGAHDKNGNLATFTQKHAPWIELTAPGVDVVSDYLTGTVLVRHRVETGGSVVRETRFDGSAHWSGTSFAAAYVSGVIAANTVPDHRPAHDAARQLLHLADGETHDGVAPYLPRA